LVSSTFKTQRGDAMRRLHLSLFAGGVCLLFAVAVYAQGQTPAAPDSPAATGAVAASSQAVVPRLMKFTGTLHDAAGKPISGAVDVTFALYGTEAGGEVLWFETQGVAADEHGRYAALLGAMHTEGLPVDLFTSGEARWLGVQVGREAEQKPRVLLLSVPYALKASDADTLGGKPASAFVQTETMGAASGNPSSATAAASSGANAGKTAKDGKSTTKKTNSPACSSVTSDGSATANSVAKFTASCNIQNSAISEVGGFVGIGTTTPTAALTVQTGSGYGIVHTDGTRKMTTYVNPGGGWFGTASNDPLYLFTNGGNPQIALLTNGNAGIGTNAPANRLVVGSEATGATGAPGSTIEVGNPSGNSFLTLGQDSNDKAVLKWVYNSSPAYGYVSLSAANGTSVLALQQNGGNVGIGTATPISGLTLQTGTGYGFVHTDGARSIGTYINASGGWFGTQSNHPLLFYTAGGNPQMTLLTNGNFGIGTTNPGAKLDVSGTANFSAGTAGVTAVIAQATDVTASNTGVSGLADGPAGVGVYGEANLGALSFGVWGASTNGLAGRFDGNVQVTGSISKAGGSFKIDHPLDPANMYLYHSFVESPDMKNIYDGVVTLDSNGEAAVQLPEWFESLNSDFRYQLTCIGGFAPVYVADEIAQNRFRIAGGKPGMKVSWQVTGTRQDAWAKAHRIPVEEAKPANERGFFLHPELFGEPEENGISWADHPEQMRRSRAAREALPH
jgi:hypothetical protein